MINSRNSLGGLVVAATLLGAAAQAATVETGQVFVNPNFTGGSGPFGETVTQPGPINISGSATGGFGSFGDGTLHLEDGIIKMSGSFFGSGSTVVRGIYRDDILFTSPGVADGTLATVTFQLSLSGSLVTSAGGIAQSLYSLQADLGGGFFDINKSAQVTNTVFSGDPFGVYSATVTVQVGFLAPLDVELTGTAGASFDFIGPGSADFFLDHSLYWAGITSFKVGGNEVPFTAIGADGIDWAQSFVPAAQVTEPGTYAMLVAGLGVIGFIARRRTRKAV